MLKFPFKLYRVERQLTDLKEKRSKITAADIISYRQKHSVPLLNELKAFLEKNISKCPKDSLTCTIRLTNGRNW